MSNNEVEIIEGDIVDLTARPQANGGLLDTNLDTILYMADKAEKAIEAMNRIMDAALRITNELDWVLIGGKPYLQESGTTKVAGLFGISIQSVGNPVKETDAEGYVSYTYKVRLYLKDRYVECEGSRSMKDDFFRKTKNGLKKPDEIAEYDVKKSAYTNAVGKGIKMLIPNLRNIDVATLERAGLDVSRINGYTFKEGAKGGSSKAAEESGLVCSKCGKAVTQKVASYAQSKYGAILCMDCQKGAAQ